MISIHGILRKLLVAAACATLAGTAVAEDIDIYTTTGVGSDLPNVLLMLDNTANWSSNIGNPCKYNDAEGNETTEGPRATNPDSEQGTKMAIVKCALHNVIIALPVKKDAPANADAEFNVGLMLLNESPSSINGGYPRVRFLPMTTQNKALMLTAVKALAINDDKGNNGAFSKALYEMYLYFKGMAPYKGNLGTKYDPGAFSGGNYVSPALDSCARNHIIFIGNGSPQGAENNDALALLQSIGGGSSQRDVVATSIISNSEQANWANEFAYFLRHTDVSSKDGIQSITTHAVAVTGASSDGTFPNFMKSVAKAGDGVYVSASDARSLAIELGKVFHAIQSVNQVWASASLPVAVNARGTFMNQVYMGVFRPDGQAGQRWRGNLKQYQFAADALGKLSMVDANGDQAINSQTGFILPTATSFWTTSSTFWTNEQMGVSGASDRADGDVVEKGGAAQRLRATFATSQDARKVYTCIGCTTTTTLGATDATRFNAANTSITATMLGVADATARTTLIEWIRGKDNAGDEDGPGGTTTVRPSIHGDVLHSRPAVINYGGSIGVVVFYGANDGMLHAIDGNRTGDTPGEELWSFIPEEMFGKLNRLRTNSPPIKLSTTTSTSATPRHYFVDGPIGVYQRIGSSGTTSKAIIYVGMRRGGRQLYAFDVTTPSAPKLLWKHTSGTLTSMGQTWSEPKVGRIRGRTDPVIIVGGGYDDTAEDALVPGTTTMGNKVFVFDAFSGELLRQFDGPTRSVAADLSVIDTDYDGYVDRAYAVDTGGGVWRIDFEGGGNQALAKEDWTIFKLADLSGGTSTPRKFFYPPSVVLTSGFAALMFGSGDREKPLQDDTTDHFFSIFDRNVEKGQPAEATLITFASLAAATSTPSTTGDGCYLPMAVGEKVVNAATTIGGNSYFGTNQPKPIESTNTCVGNLGIARGYSMPLFCAAGTSVEYPGGGLPPSPISGTVAIRNTDGSTTSHHFYTGGPNTAGPVAPTDPEIKVTNVRKRIYWYQQTNR